MPVLALINSHVWQIVFLYAAREIPNLPLAIAKRLGLSSGHHLALISVLKGEAMPSSEQLKFAHRFIPDGTVDSICPRCFVTVGSASNETDLVPKEEHHVCDPFLVAHYEFFKKMPRSEIVSECISRDQKRPL